MKYILTEKLSITNDFIADLTEKSWQDIEYLQTQIANIEQTETSAEVIQLFKNLLTSYYVFVGGLERIKDHNTVNISDSEVAPTVETSVNSTSSLETPSEPLLDKYQPALIQELAQVETEPFEYFVDFDEPIGEPLTDKDLYN